MGVGGGGQAGGKAGGHISRTLGAGQILDPVTQTLRFKTVLAGGGAGVEPQRAGAATARAAEEGPAALVEETDVLEGDDEGGSVGGGPGR